MVRVSEADHERRRFPRAQVYLPVRLYDVDRDRQLAAGSTLNVSGAGILVECSGSSAFPAELSGTIDVSLQLPDEKPLGDPFGTRIVRYERSDPTRIAMQILGGPGTLLHAPRLVGQDPRMLEIKSQIVKAAAHDANVLLSGESGTGKNLAAEAVHAHSERKQFPFVRVNCPSIPDSLFENQLFGNKKGAYTGATSARPGLFSIADRGTILLDEISAIPFRLQAKLLRVIEDKTFIPVGGSKPVRVRARIIATTNEDLKARVEAGSFRRDLFYRLHEIDIILPPLRERRADIQLLTHHLLREYCIEFDKDYESLPPGVSSEFQKYQWPGNVRELENTIKRGLLMDRFATPRESAGGESEQQQQRPEGSNTAPSCPTLEKARKQAERGAIRQALRDAGNRTDAANALGICYRTLQRKLKELSGEVGIRSGTRGTSVQQEHLFPTQDLRDVSQEAEKTAVIRALQATAGNKMKAASLLGVSYRTVLRKLKEYEVHA